MEAVADNIVFEDLLEKYDHFMVDWDGVLYSGSSAIEGSPEAIQLLIKNNKSIYFITNSSGRTGEGLKKKLQKYGIGWE